MSFDFAAREKRDEAEAIVHRWAREGGPTMQEGDIEMYDAIDVLSTVLAHPETFPDQEAKIEGVRRNAREAKRENDARFEEWLAENTEQEEERGGRGYNDAPAPLAGAPPARSIKLREEYVALLKGDVVRALLLEAALKIYPRAIPEYEIAKVAMIRDSDTVVSRHLRALMRRKYLRDTGYIPTHYRVNLVALSRDLEALGYVLPEYPDPDYQRMS